MANVTAITSFVAGLHGRAVLDEYLTDAERYASSISNVALLLHSYTWPGGDGDGMAMLKILSNKIGQKTWFNNV